jgi:hypothetical protein
MPSFSTSQQQKPPRLSGSHLVPAWAIGIVIKIILKRNIAVFNMIYLLGVVTIRISCPVVFIKANKPSLGSVLNPSANAYFLAFLIIFAEL